MESFLQTTSFGWAMEDKSSSLSLSGKYESLGYATHTCLLNGPYAQLPCSVPSPGTCQSREDKLSAPHFGIQGPQDPVGPSSLSQLCLCPRYHRLSYVIICLFCESGQRLPAVGSTAFIRFLPLMTPLPHFLTRPELLTPLSYLRQGQLCVSPLGMFSDSLTRGSRPRVRMSSMKWRDSGFLLHLLDLVLLPAS